MIDKFTGGKSKNDDLPGANRLSIFAQGSKGLVNVGYHTKK
jgi:hypothetical protein